MSMTEKEKAIMAYVAKHSPFTKSLTKALKKSERVSIEFDETSGFVYVCNGFFLARLDKQEYDCFVRPVTDRDPGTFSIMYGKYTNCPLIHNIRDTLYRIHIGTIYELEKTPVIFTDTITSKNKHYTISTYYSQKSDLVMAFNTEYESIVKGSLYKGTNGKDPMVVYTCHDPIALILPFRLPEESRIANAVRAFCK